MDKQFPRFIQFDGVRGVGKTTQSKILTKYLKSIGYDAELITLKSFDSTMQCIRYVIETLKNTDKILIQDGSISREIITLMVRGVHRDKIQEKFKEELRLLETIYHEYNVVGLILLNDDLTVCQERLEKKAKILGSELYGINDLLEEGSILNLFHIFDDDIISKSNKYEVLVHSDECILDIHEEIVKRLQ